MSVSPLICYEDIITGPARESVQNGAELLVNLTNDAWFGDSIAPYQHNLIASFRSIENRRYLVRSTNTGLTAIIDPYGRSVSTLPAYADGTLLAQVRLMSYKSVYTKYLGDWPWWGLSIVILLISLSGSIIGRSKGIS